MNFTRPQARYKASLDITPLIDVVFLLLVFLLLTMTFTEERPEIEEAIINIDSTVDLILVVGDVKSSNSKRLLEIAEQSHPNVESIMISLVLCESIFL